MVIPNVLRPAQQWRDPRHRRGLAGELVAARYLQAHGWAVLAHRFRLGRHDVDLVARQGDVIAFVEVKTRRSEAFGGARQAVGWRKRLVLELVAAGWITDRGRPEWRYRFDLIEVAWGRGQGSYPHVSHIEDAWRGVRK